MVKALKVVNREQCIGCYSCMYACSRMLRNFGGTHKAALRVKSYSGSEGTFSVRVCAGCLKPDCAEACPTGALSAAEGGGVRFKKEKCSHCKRCVSACKIAALQWDVTEKIPLPCIQCGQCAKYCPNQVLALIERETKGES